MIIVYHADCCDGFTAAWVLSKRYPMATFVPARYGEDLIPMPGEHYIFVDFCFKRPVMEEFLAAASSLLVLDHHKTAAEGMVGFPNCIFDMEKSGARLAWEFVGKSDHQEIVSYVEDRDMWWHSLERTHEVNAVIQSCEKTFEVWDRLDVMVKYDFRNMVGQGRALLNANKQTIATRGFLKQDGRRNFNTKDGLIWGVNSPVLVSELLHELCAGEPYAVAYHRLANGMWKYSLRSDENGVDVSEVAKRYPGGGGHEHAAGFTSYLGPDQV